MPGSKDSESNEAERNESQSTADGFDADEFLDSVDFDPEQSFLTRRQAKVLVLRNRGLKQATIAENLGTSRANVSGIEKSARENIEQARETIAFATVLEAPVRVEIPASTDLYEVPDLVFDACDDADLKVPHNAPDLMKLISDAADDVIDGREIRHDISVSVTTNGEIKVRVP